METMVKTKWAIDKMHSEVQFKAKHLVISTVTGHFKEFDGGLEIEDDNLESAKAWFSAEVISITTNQDDRDNHLKSADFFDAENYPEIKFESTGFEKTGSDQYKMTGDITIRGTSKPISLDVVYGGSMEDPYGNTKSGYAISGQLNRHDFGLKWNAVTEAGGVVVGETIKIELNIQLTRQ